MPIRQAASLLCLLASAGCAGGAPLLHRVHPLGDGQVQAGAGMSATVTQGALRRALDAEGASGPARTRAAAGAETISPGVAPWIAARAGLGNHNEVELSYTARALRLSGRHVFEDGSVGLSVGAGASMLLDDRDDGHNAARWSLNRSSLGFDVPILVGWRSSAEIVTLYAGPRFGFERIAGDFGLNETAAEPAVAPSDVRIRHWYTAGLVGITLGFRHVHGALELQTTYHRVDGRAGSLELRTNGVTLTPAAGLIITF